MILDLLRIVKREYRVRSFEDRRRIVNRVIVEYEDSTRGATRRDVFRKSFEGKLDREIEIPNSGTHAELNAMQYQWKIERSGNNGL